jgi:uncharacterized phage protein gp47/JayE
MALNNIILDDKRWITIAEEARLLIPSFSRDWTDHNVHDPGITFLELFAWLEEIQRYRLNRTSATIRNRFFSLVGIQPAGPQPAVAVVEFDWHNQTTQHYVLIPAATPLNITAHLDILFETITDTCLVDSAIQAVETQEGERTLDRTAANRDGAGHFDTFGQSPSPGDSLIITFSPGITAPAIALAFRVFDSDLAPVPAGRLPIPSAQLQWEYETAGRWQPLTSIRDTTAALTLSGLVTFTTPLQLITRVRATIAGGRYEIPPCLAAIRLNALEVRQTARVVNLDLEAGTGLPDQQQTLPHLPLRENPTPIIQVGSPAGLEDWSPVEDFSDSDSASKHYTFDPATGEIAFGNGFNGEIPQSAQRIVVKDFRYTEGVRGNLSPGMTWRLAAPPQAATAVGTNPLPCIGGKDAESSAETELRARKQFRRSIRAVTAADFETLARQTPGLRVARAKALPGCNPQCPEVDNAGDVTVVVLPATRPGNPPAVEPSPGFLATVTRQLQSARLVANRVHVIGPSFVDLDITVTVTLKKTAAPANVRRDVDQSLRGFLAPNQWPFGRSIFPSEIHQRLMSVAGVAYISEVKINGSSNPKKLGPTQLPGVLTVTQKPAGVRDV